MTRPALLSIILLLALFLAHEHGVWAWIYNFCWRWQVR